MCGNRKAVISPDLAMIHAQSGRDRVFEPKRANAR